MRAAILVTVLFVSSCGKKGGGDDCQRFVDKSRVVIEELAKKAGKPVSELDKLVDTCREKHGKPGNKDDAMVACVLGADGDAAVKSCWDNAFKSYANAGRASEAKLMLNRIGKSAKRAYGETNAFVAGKVGPVPDKACCSFPDHKCPGFDDRSDPVWTALDFEIEEPHLFQYSYDGTATAATATAIGDLDCSGTTITYQLKLSVDGGAPKTELVEPANAK